MGELRTAEVSGNSSSSNEVVDETPKQMLSRFYSLQEERVQTYSLFEEGFQAYLKGAPNYNFPLYRQLVKEITETFNKISADILSIKSKFAEWNNLLSISEILGKIQDAEKNKLELTAKLQLCRQKVQSETSDTAQTEVEDIKQQGFQAYLKGAPNYNFPLYRQLVKEITETFNKISADILSIKSKFAEWNNLLPISEILGKIQDAEKNKLELTAKLQLCRQKVQSETSDTAQTEVENIKQQLKENRDFLVEQMEELKYESEDLYAEEDISEPEAVDSTLSAER